MIICAEGKMQWRDLGENQLSAIRVQHENIELPTLSIDKSANKEVPEHNE